MGSALHTVRLEYGTSIKLISKGLHILNKKKFKQIHESGYKQSEADNIYWFEKTALN